MTGWSKRPREPFDRLRANGEALANNFRSG